MPASPEVPIQVLFEPMWLNQCFNGSRWPTQKLSSKFLKRIKKKDLKLFYVEAVSAKVRLGFILVEEFKSWFEKKFFALNLNHPGFVRTSDDDVTDVGLK